MIVSPGVYPYERYPDVQSLSEAKSLPPIEDFYNTLTESHLDPQSYEEGQQCFDFFGCSSMKDYMVLYLQKDTFLLAEVFCRYRDIVLEQFGLDPAWLVSYAKQQTFENNFIFFPAGIWACLD